MTLAGCDRIAATTVGARTLGAGESLTATVHRWLAAGTLAQEFTEADLSPEFRANGTELPDDPAWQAHARTGFAHWSLQVTGLVQRPTTFTLAELHAMPARTQITRHDCVEGWSAIGKWTGVPLAQVLARVAPQPQARYAVFHCADTMPGGLTRERYYESIGMDDALHPQTLLAYGLNGADLPIKNGAPIRLRVERQLGYKQAKFVQKIELVASLSGIGRGKGGYWEDNDGYQWYAGV